MINFILNSISIIATYIVAIGFLFYVFNKTASFFLPTIKYSIITVVSFVGANILLFTFCEFYLPWK